MKMRRSDQVVKTIGAVSEICDTEQFVLFNRSGGAIIKDPSEAFSRWIIETANSPTLFDRCGSTYSMDMWIPSNPKSKEAAKPSQRKTTPLAPSTTARSGKAAQLPESSAQLKKKVTIKPDGRWKQRQGRKVVTVVEPVEE